MYARIINNFAVDVCENPTELFHADIAAEFVEVPDDVQHGWYLTDGTFAPVIVEEKPVYPQVGPIHFQMLWTAEEITEAVKLRDTDPAIANFWKLVDDPRTDVIDLSLQNVQIAVEYTLTKIEQSGVALDVQGRLKEILSGKL